VRSRLLSIVAAGTIATMLAVAGCAGQVEKGADLPAWAQPPTESPSESPSPSASPSPSPSPSKKPSPKPTKAYTKPVTPGADIPNKPASPPPTNDGVPPTGDGTFTIATGGGAPIGSGTSLVKYLVEVENGIVWGDNEPWTAGGFATKVDAILAGPRSWIASADAPVTNAAESLSEASWSFQRVSDDSYAVRIRLASPATVDKLCGSVGLKTGGVYSCRYGKNILINLRRWLRGAGPGFDDVNGVYRPMVINHEVGHYLGFDHMTCPAGGGPAPIMQNQTISLGNCQINPYPFTADRLFVTGPWAPS
jgi:hypothetical protein